MRENNRGAIHSGIAFVSLGSSCGVSLSCCVMPPACASCMCCQTLTGITLLVLVLPTSLFHSKRKHALLMHHLTALACFFFYPFFFIPAAAREMRPDVYKQPSISPASPDFPWPAAAITPSSPDSNATSEIRKSKQDTYWLMEFLNGNSQLFPCILFFFLFCCVLNRATKMKTDPLNAVNCRLRNCPSSGIPKPANSTASAALTSSPYVAEHS